MEKDNRDIQGKKSRRVAVVISIALHGCIILIFFFLAAWKAPDPPIPDYGIELNFGLDAAGFGDTQPEQTATPVSENESVENPPVEQSDDSPSQSEPDPVVAEVESLAETKIPVKEQKSPESEKKPVDQKKKETDVKEQPIKKEAPEKSKPVIDPKALFTPGEQSSVAEKQPGHGNVPVAKGDQGIKEGKIDSKALYGTPGQGSGGSGSGSGLDVAGWRWDREPNPTLPATEKGGKLVFEIELDEHGEIIKLISIERGLSPAAEKICREEILKRKFTPLGEKVPPVSRGRVTFVVKAH